MSRTTAASIGALAALMLAQSAYAMPMSGTMTGHIDSQNAQPMGGPNKLKIEETASGTNASPAIPSTEPSSRSTRSSCSPTVADR